MAPSIAESLQLVVLASGLAVAVIIDCRSRRIPNVLVFTLAGLGLILSLASDGPGGSVASLGGLLVGLGVLLPFWLLGGFGAGDVKLMAAAGAFLGPVPALGAAAATLVIGSILALMVACWKLFIGTSLPFSANAVLVLQSPWQSLRGLRGVRFPYAIAIAMGVLVSLIWSNNLPAWLNA